MYFVVLWASDQSHWASHVPPTIIRPIAITEAIEVLNPDHNYIRNVSSCGLSYRRIGSTRALIHHENVIMSENLIQIPVGSLELWVWYEWLRPHLVEPVICRLQRVFVAENHLVMRKTHSRRFSIVHEVDVRRQYMNLGTLGIWTRNCANRSGRNINRRDIGPLIALKEASSHPSLIAAYSGISEDEENSDDFGYEAELVAGFVLLVIGSFCLSKIWWKLNVDYDWSVTVPGAVTLIMLCGLLICTGTCLFLSGLFGLT